MSALKMSAAAALALVLTACDVAPPIEQETTAQGVNVFLIAVVDGCNVWGIDRGALSRPIYMARCPEGAADVMSTYTTSNGKTSTTHSQQTIGAKK